MTRPHLPQLEAIWTRASAGSFRASLPVVQESRHQVLLSGGGLEDGLYEFWHPFYPFTSAQQVSIGKLDLYFSFHDYCYDCTRLGAFQAGGEEPVVRRTCIATNNGMHRLLVEPDARNWLSHDDFVRTWWSQIAGTTSVRYPSCIVSCGCGGECECVACQDPLDYLKSAYFSNNFWGVMFERHDRKSIPWI